MWRKLGSLASCLAVIISIFPAVMLLEPTSKFGDFGSSHLTSEVSLSAPEGFSCASITAELSKVNTGYFSSVRITADGQEGEPTDLPLSEDPLSEEYNSNHLFRWPSPILNFGNQAGLIWNGHGYVQEAVFFGNLLFMPGCPITQTYLTWTVTTGVSGDAPQYFYDCQFLQNNLLLVSTDLSSIPEVTFPNISENPSIPALGTTTPYPILAEASKRISISGDDAGLEIGQRHRLCNINQVYLCMPPNADRMDFL